ncbi:MAG: head-tail adaptor protein [Rhodocyclaceae bacterium]|nr:MAG: head-tail adaptor protein [Rhodocyclaceae bacterium]
MSAISAGQLNHRIRIQRPMLIKDALGAPSQTWADVATVWADIQPLSGREARMADRIAAEITHQITVRYRSEFDEPKQIAQMRVLHRGRVFALHAALNDDEAGVAVILLATEGLRGG